MADSQVVRLGTRGSSLARWQANWVAGQIADLRVQVQVELIQTTGDVESGPIGRLAAQGVFTKEIQQALLDHRIDLAVHSLKDLPTERVDGLSLAAVPPRAAEGDALLSRDGRTFTELPAEARVATGSQRRRAQLWFARPDLQLLDVRGNIDTRLRKLADGGFDALVLAEAGLTRLGLADEIVEVFDKQVMLPAVGQGALGLETRSDDTRTRQIVEHLNHRETWRAVSAERSLLAHLCGGCLAPIGAWCRPVEGQLWLDAVVLSTDGRRRLYETASADGVSPEELGIQVAQRLLDQGASDLIASSRRPQ